jgi:hypothetical protein
VGRKLKGIAVQSVRVSNIGNVACISYEPIKIESSERAVVNKYPPRILPSRVPSFDGHWLMVVFIPDSIKIVIQRVTR